MGLRMLIDVKRKTFTDTSTVGELWADGKFVCYTLEDKVRPVKVYGETAIPAGTYPIVVTFSERFKRDMPLVQHVPNFAGIRIHAGNTARDTRGCILVGLQRGKDTVLRSRDAYRVVLGLIRSAIGKGEKVTLTIA